MISTTDWEELLQGIERPGRYLGCEVNARRKDFAEARIRMALAFPDLYEVGMSHLGMQILYHRLNLLEGVLADRVFMPARDMEARLRERCEPLRALESRRPLRDFDLVGFSLQYELSYTNLLTMLDLAGIPLRCEARTAADPWVIAGGPCAFNAEPLADFLDIVVLGEAEECLGELLTVYGEWRAARGTRQEFLEAVSRIAGVYVPSFFEVDHLSDGRIAAIRPRYPAYARVSKRLVAHLDEGSPIAERPLVPLGEIVHDRLSLEIARGCTRGCRFCQAGYLYRPVRERHPRTVFRAAEAGLAASGFEELSLLSLSSGDYCQIHHLLSALVNRFAAHKVAVSFPSLRVGTLTPDLMDLVRRVRKTGFTLAPEAGSERLRAVINKAVRDDDLLATASTAFALGWRVLKLYFMIGLPTETTCDLEGLVALCLKVWQIAGRQAPRASLNVAVSTFVPKPHTPFQWSGQLPLGKIQENVEFLRNRLNRRGLRYKWHLPEQSLLEAVFARGDRRLGATLVRAWRLGARFDGWADGFDGALWDQAFHDTGLAPHFYATRERSGDEVFPWDHLSTGVDRSYLWKEYENALAGTWTPDCRSHPCTQCGVCDHRVIRPQLHDGSAVPVETSGAVSGAQRELGAFVYRLSYAKKGDMRFFGQLEVTRALARALRRAALPVAYSAGFHPHAKLSFGGALPLGMESEVEEAHVTLTAPLDAKTLMERLNQELPAGMTVLAAVPVTRRAPEAPRQRVTYRIEALPPLTAAQLARTWRRCLEERLVKKGKRHTREIPLGAVLLDLRQVGPGALEMDLLESHEVRLRPTAIVDHLAAAGREGELTYRVCKIAVQPVRGDENAGRTHRQRQGL